MKKTMAILITAVVAGSMSASATLIAGWDTWKWQNAGDPTSVPTYTDGTTGSAIQSGTWSIGSGIGSTDGTFGGTVSTPAASTDTTASGSGYRLSNGADGSIDFVVTDTTGSAVDLTTFHFDANRLRSGSAENWTLDIVAGDLSNVNIGSGVLPNLGGSVNPYTQFDLDLTGLADSTLDANGSVTFRLSITGGNGANGQHTMVDNVGVSAIPEPGTLGLVVVSAGGLLFFRRRTMLKR